MAGVERAAVRVAFAIYLAGLLVWLGLGLVPAHVEHPDMAAIALDATTPLETVVQYLFSVLNLALGLLLFLRRPDELVPRLLAFAMLGTAATFNLPSHRAFHLTGSPWPIAFVHFTFHVVSGVAYIWAVVLFPDGRIPRRARLSTGQLRFVVLLSTGAATWVCWRGSFLDHPQFFLVFFGIAVALIGVTAQALRIFDSRTTARDRAAARLLLAALLPAFAAALVWLAASAAVSLTGMPAGAEALRVAVERLFPAVFALVPVVLFAGVVRYRLWDIDRLVSRVLVFCLLALALSGAYVVAVVAGSRLAGGGLWVTAVTLTLAAVLVEPLRTVGRRWANRVVFGQVLSPSEAMRSLAEALEHLTPAEELEHVVSVVVAATRATCADLWLLDGDRLLHAAGAPADLRRPAEVRLTHPERSAAALAAAVGATRGWQIRHQGELLGLLTAGSPPGDRLGTADDAVGTAIAAHAGLLVHNATLTVTLARQVDALAEQAEELAKSRRRVIAAQDAERRVLERALHDGAQQALVAAVIAARSSAARAPVPREESGEVHEVLLLAQRDVNQLSGDDTPAPLTRLGLAGGLEEAAELARRTGLVVEVAVDVSSGREPDAADAAVRRLPPEIETAVYFSCVEGLQNVTKYARARTAWVQVHRHAGEVRFSVVDDGRGIDAGYEMETGAGGLHELARRLAPLAGQLSVARNPHGGTVLRGSVPLPRTASVGG